MLMCVGGSERLNVYVVLHIHPFRHCHFVFRLEWEYPESKAEILCNYLCCVVSVSGIILFICAFCRNMMVIVCFFCLVISSFVRVF